MNKRKEKEILVVVAHPDDEILGCGGTVARLIREGWNVTTLILGQGIESRLKKIEQSSVSAKIENLKQAAHRANKIIGVENLIIHDFPDNAFDSIPLLEITKKVEEIIDNIQPELVITHNELDLNIDHQKTFQAVLTAARPLPGTSIQTILSCEVCSSTEWQFTSSFAPSVFFNISDTLELKLNALSIYAEEIREFPHPRSLEAVEHLARWRGSQIGCEAAEAFICIRDLR